MNRMIQRLAPTIVNLDIATPFEYYTEEWSDGVRHCLHHRRFGTVEGDSWEEVRDRMKRRCEGM